MIGNHPLGHLAECGVFTLAQRLGYTGRALPVLQLCNAIAGAAAVAVFLVFLTTVLSVQRVRAIGWSVMLGAAYGCWYQAGVADIYSVSMLLLVLAWTSVVRYLTQPSHALNSVLVGMLTGIAILTHQFNGILLTAGVIGLLPFVRGRAGQSLPLALSIGLSGAVVTVVIGYALLGALFLGAWSLADIIMWVTGYGTTHPYGRSLTFEGVKGAAYALGETLLAYVDETGPLRLLGVSVLGICGVLLLVGLSAIRLLPEPLRAMVLACGLQCAVGWWLIVWWSPINVGHGTNVGKWWMLTLPALLSGCACALEGLVHKGRDSLCGRRLPWHRLWAVVPLLLGACVLVLNASGLLRQRAPNRPVEQALHEWVTHSGPEDVLILNWEVFHAHLLYWEKRAGVVDFYQTLLANKDSADRFTSLRAVIEQAVQHHHTVLAVPYSDNYYSNEQMHQFGLTAQDVRHFFDQYSWQGPLFSYQAGGNGPVQHVYQLTLPHGEQ